MDQKKTGGFLRELRKEKRITQEQLAEALGVTNRSVSRWENGNNMPDLDLIIELADYFDISLEELLDGERKGIDMEKETKDMALKVADYSNEEKLKVSRRMHMLFLAGIFAFCLYLFLDVRGLADAGVYERIASASLGFVLGMLLAGALYTSRYMAKIKAFKQRLLGRRNK